MNRMKLTLLLSAMVSLFSLPVLGQIATVSGNLKDLGTVSVTSSNTYVEFELKNYGSTLPQVVGTTTIATRKFRFNPDSNGAISGSVYRNGSITPSGTYYRVCVFDNGRRFRCNDYDILLSSFNLNTAAAKTTSPNPGIPSNIIVSFRHTQATGATTWTISHNFGVTGAVCTFFDDSAIHIEPDSWTQTDINTITATFLTSQTGHADCSAVKNLALVASTVNALILNPTADQTGGLGFDINWTGDILVAGHSLSSRTNGDVIYDGSDNTSLQATIDTWVALAVDGGKLFHPWNNILTTAQRVTGTTIDVGTKGSDWLFGGTGGFSSQLSLEASANTVLFTSGNNLQHSRPKIAFMGFDCQKATQTGSSSCLELGVGTSGWDTSKFMYNVVTNSIGKGVDLGGSAGSTDDHLFIGNVFTNNDAAALHVNQKASDVKSFFNQYTLNDTAIRHQWLVPTGTRFLSVGDHIETSATAGVRVDVGSSFQMISPLITSSDIHFGLQTNSSFVIGGRMNNDLIHDNGQYNTFMYVGCSLLDVFPTQAGGCPMRNRYPTKDLHLPESIVADWDMELEGVASWTAFGSATVTKTAWISGIDGKRYLKISCSTATVPCGVTQAFTDTIGGEALITVRYASDDGSGAQPQILIKGTSTLYIDSGTLSTPKVAIGSGFHYGEYKFRTTASNTDAGTWEITLQCNAAGPSPASACYFTDIQVLPSLVTNGNFEQDADGVSPPTGWVETLGNVETDTAEFFTGTNSALLQEVANQIHMAQASTLSLTAGRDYLFSAMMRRGAVGANDSLLMGYGNVNNAAVDTGFIALNTNKRCTVDHTFGIEWQYVECIITSDGTDLPIVEQISFGTIDTLDLANGWVDDVAVVELRENSQLQRSTFREVRIEGNTTSAGNLNLDGSLVVNDNADAIGVLTVKGDTKDFLLCTDATNDRVGIGMTGSCDPANFALDVEGNVIIDNDAAATVILAIQGGVSGEVQRSIEFRGFGGAAQAELELTSTNTFSIRDSGTTDRLSFGTTGFDDNIYKCFDTACDHQFQLSDATNLARFDGAGDFLFWSGEAFNAKFQHGLGQTTAFTLRDPGQTTANLSPVLIGSASLDYDLSGAGITCQDLTVAVTGAATDDEVAIGIPDALASTAGVLFSFWVSSAGTVTVRACDVTSGNPNPAAATVQVSVLK